MQSILETSIKITNEPPTGMQANLHKALDNFDQGGFQLEFESISGVINHMTCYNSSALIGWNYSIQSGEQILYRIFLNKFSNNESTQIYNRSCDL